MRLITLVAAIVALAVAVPFASAGKPTGGPTLFVSVHIGSQATTGSVPYGTPYTIWGCGYGSDYVSVAAYSPEAISFTGQRPDANGCISISNFSTNAPGKYTVKAAQQVHRSTKWTEVASTTFVVS